MSQNLGIDTDTPAPQSAGLPDWLRWGLILGGLQIAFTAVQYMIDPALMIAWWNSLLALGLLIALMVAAALERRKALGGYLSYGESVWLMCRVCMVGGLLSVVFIGLLYNVIDTELDEKMKELTLEKTEQMLENFNAPSDQIEETMEAMEKRDFSQTPRSLGIAWMVSLIFGLFLALIASAFTRKNEPLFSEGSTEGND